MGTNFWDLNYVWWMLGFLLIPRVTIMCVFINYVTNGFMIRDVCIPISIWWLFPQLGLGLFSKLGVFVGYGFFPRLLLGIIGCIYLPENRVFMVAACVIGLLIDIGVKAVREFRRAQTEE